jgi:hypothetical protein
MKLIDLGYGNSRGYLSRRNLFAVSPQVWRHNHDVQIVWRKEVPGHANTNVYSTSSENKGFR